MHNHSSPSLFDSLLEFIYSVSKKSPLDYTNLETSSNRRTFVFRDQTLATVILFHGMKRVAGTPESKSVVSNLVDAVTSNFEKESFHIDFILDCDLMTVAEMKRLMRPVYDTARNLQMANGIFPLLDEQAETMAAVTNQETKLLVLYTLPTALNPDDYKSAISELVADRRAYKVFTPKGTQDETFALDPLQTIHDAFVDKLTTTLEERECGCSLQVLDCDEASNLLKRMLDRRGTDPEWRAWVRPESSEAIASRFALRKGSEPLKVKAPARVTKERPRILEVANAAIYLPPPLNEQIVDQDASYDRVKGSGARYLRYGNRIYATLIMKVPPRREVTAQQLITTLSTIRTRVAEKEQRVPFRIAYKLRATGLSTVQMRAGFAPLVAIGHPNNRKLMHAYNALKDEQTKKEMAMASLSMSITTWVDADEPNAHTLLASRIGAINGATSKWGDVQVTENTLDRFESLIGSCGGLSTKELSNEAVGTLADILPLLPWTRPATPLSPSGTEFYRSRDGALMPTEAHSSAQDYWLETITAPMGGGKSVSANIKHFNFIFAPGRTSLPFLHIMDIGGSANGIVDLLEDAAPDDMKHLFYRHTLRNEAAHCVNMLDPKLGLRYPLEGDLQTTVEFVTALATPPEVEKPFQNMSEFARVALKATYRKFDDANENGSCRRYQAGQTDPDARKIDAKLSELRISVTPGKTSWYEVADKLIAAGCEKEAVLAHRRGSPTLPDLIAVAQDNNVQAEYRQAPTEMGVPVPSAFVTQLTIAMQSYPIFNGMSRLDLRGRHVTSIDLQQVTGGNTTAMQKQSSLMFMVAYELFQRNIRIEKEDLDHIPMVWQPYYRQLIEKLQNTDKHITMDEYHRTMKGPKHPSADNLGVQDTSGIRATLVREGGRESRKWQLSLTTISQLMTDHGLLLQLASANHIIKRGSQGDINFQKAALNLSPTDITAMQHFVNGPEKGVGVTILSQWVTKKGPFNQLFTSTIAPKMLWALSSVFEDKAVRNILSERFGRDQALQILARRYPGGTVKDEVQRLKLRDNNLSDEDLSMGASRKLAEEIAKLYEANPMRFNIH